MARPAAVVQLAEPEELEEGRRQSPRVRKKAPAGLGSAVQGSLALLAVPHSRAGLFDLEGELDMDLGDGDDEAQG